MWIVITLIILVLVGIKVYQLLSPAQRAWLRGHAGAAAGAPRLIGGIALVIIAIIIAIWGGLFQADPSAMDFAAISKWVWGHGPALLLIAGVAAIAVAFYGGAIKETLFWVLGGILLFLFVGTWLFSQWEASPSTSKGVSPSEMVLTLGPGEKSKRIAVPYQMHVVMHGKDFRYHCVYGNGKEVSFLPGEAPCPSGDIPYVYAENLRKGDNAIAYSYAK